MVYDLSNAAMGAEQGDHNNEGKDAVTLKIAQLVPSTHSWSKCVSAGKFAQDKDTARLG